MRTDTGDADRFAHLVAEHDRPLRALAFRLLGDRQAMDDVLQEAYAKAFRALPQFRGESATGTWLYRIVYNACLDHLRRERRLAEQPLETGLPATPDPGESAARREALAAALAALAPDQRAAVLLVDAEGLDYAAAARVLGVRVGTVASRLSRARASLRRALAAEPEGVES